MYKIFLCIFFSPLFVSCKQQYNIPERDIENDRELMTRNVECDPDNYSLVIQDSIEYSKDSPYAFYYPDKFNNCRQNTLIISKLQIDLKQNTKFADLYFGEHRYQKLFTGMQQDTIVFDYCDYHFTIKNDTILVKPLKQVKP
jgi:hypothetical protein